MDAVPAVAFRGRRVDLWPTNEAPLGRKADPDVFLRRDIEFRENGHRCPLELSAPMLMHPDAGFSEPWDGPFRPEGIEEVEELWKNSDGKQLLLSCVASHFYSFDTGAGQREPNKWERALGGKPNVRQIELFKQPELWPALTPNPMTEDGQAWFAALTSYMRPAQHREGYLTVLFPYTGKNGHKTRPMLMYSLFDVSEEHRIEAVRRLALIFKHDAVMEALRLKRAA